MSMSSIILASTSAFVASLIEGAGLAPKAEPRPVVKQMRFAPPATSPVGAPSRWPGVSIWDDEGRDHARRAGARALARRKSALDAQAAFRFDRNSPMRSRARRMFSAELA